MAAPQPSLEGYERDPQEEALWAALQAGGAAARERLFAYHAPFARRIAGRHFRNRSGSDIEFGDLHQLACAGLLEAIDGYDAGRAVPFRAYAARRISGSILDGIARMSDMREQLSFRARVRRERLGSLMEAAPRTGGAETLPALTEIAVGLAIGFLLEGTGLVASQDRSDSRPGPYQEVQLKRTVARLREGLTRLPEREAAILHHHYDEGLTFEQIGALLGLTKGRISQLHQAALALLRKRLNAAGEFRLER